MIIVAIHDKKADCYSQVHAVENTATAEREFVSACLADGSYLNQFPADFSLVNLGSFDSKVGSINNELVVIKEGVDIVKK